MGKRRNNKKDKRRRSFATASKAFFATLRDSARTVTNRISPTRTKSFWQGATAFFGATYHLAVRLPWVIVIVVIATIIIDGLTRQSTVIDPISVPKILADRGYTPEVAGQRLRDALVHYTIASKTKMRSPDVSLHGELPNIVVPTVGISLDAILSSVRTFVRSTRSRTIAGEFVLIDKQLWLRLRIDNKELYTSTKGADPEKPDELLKAAAPKVLDTIQPYVVAAAMYDNDPVGAVDKARQVIALLPSWNDNVVWSHVLIGYFHSERNQFGKALEAYNRAIELNPNFAVPYYNSGNALRDQGKIEEAIAAFRRAIALDPNYASPRNNLAVLLKNQRKYAEALKQYRRAVALEPEDAVQRHNIGILLREMGDYVESEFQYKKAVALEPTAKRLHFLAVVLRQAGKYDEAIDACRKSAAMDRKFMVTRLFLADMFEGLGRTQEAIAEYEAILADDPTTVTARNRLERLRNNSLKSDQAASETTN